MSGKGKKEFVNLKNALSCIKIHTVPKRLQNKALPAEGNFEMQSHENTLGKNPAAPHELKNLPKQHGFLHPQNNMANSDKNTLKILLKTKLQFSYSFLNFNLTRLIKSSTTSKE